MHTDTENAFLGKFTHVLEMYLQKKCTFFRHQTRLIWAVRLEINDIYLELQLLLLPLMWGNTDWSFGVKIWFENVRVFSEGFEWKTSMDAAQCSINLFRRCVFENIWHVKVAESFKIPPQTFEDASLEILLGWSTFNTKRCISNLF